MDNLLENKNILVAVTGSIAAYKTLELIRLYVKAGANVKVIMTNGAKKFINPLTFETISQNKVLDDTNEDWSTNTVNNHIAIGKWSDIFIIAPATANTIKKNPSITPITLCKVPALKSTCRSSVAIVINHKPEPIIIKVIIGIFNSLSRFFTPNVDLSTLRATGAPNIIPGTSASRREAETEITETNRFFGWIPKLAGTPHL